MIKNGENTLSCTARGRNSVDLSARLRGLMLLRSPSTSEADSKIIFH